MAKKTFLERMVNIQKNRKDPVKTAKHRYIDYYDKLPINEKAVLLEGEFGTRLDGNIFYILRYLCSSPKYEEFEFYISSWKKYADGIQSKLDAYGLDKVNLLIYSSDEYVRMLASAKYLISDVTFPNYFIKKEGQVYLNTWHGTPLKAMGKSMSDDVMIGNVQKNLVESDYLLYPNAYTREHMLDDYMLKNISPGSYVMCGYPRNTIFFDTSRIDKIKSELGISDKRVYAYMPTWRGKTGSVGNAKSSAFMIYYLYELDKMLGDDEIMYFNPHPLDVNANNVADTGDLKHIRLFPAEYEVYDFLNIADVLVTDYSSVFFDFACTGKKIVLFPYDKEDYLAERGLYLSLDTLPFPQVFNAEELANELRTGKNYDDSTFMEEFCKYDNINASAQICDLFILGEDTGLEVGKIPDNGKENVVIYAGGVEQNGLTTSLRSLTNIIDLEKRNYYISFLHSKAKNNIEQIKKFNPELNYFAVMYFFNETYNEMIAKNQFYKKRLSTKQYLALCGKRYEQNFLRSYGHAKFSHAIQFCGYETNIILMYSKFKGRKTIFVHNDMIQEIKTRNNQRKSALKYAYNTFDNVVPVSEDIVPPTVKISGRKDNIRTVHNTIDQKLILKMSEEEIQLDPTTKCSVEPEKFYEIMRSDSPKFINIGRYSPEKGHDRLVNAFYRLWQKNKDIYLIIMGGNSREQGYENLCEKLVSMGLENNVILLLSVSNPYPIVKACDYFIMSSFYEGLPMVLFEAELLGLPIAATDVKGPHGFLTRYGGTLVENSEEGVYDGLNKLLTGEAKTLGIDYDAYNRECVKEFEALFD